MKLIIALAIILTPCIASARLGETLEECTERYGEPEAIADGGDDMAFNKAGMIIYARFNSKKICDFISFRKPERFAELTPIEIEAILEKNSGGKEWAEGAGGNKFEIPGIGKVAVYDAPTRVLFIFTPEGYTRFMKRVDDVNRERLKGL